MSLYQCDKCGGRENTALSFGHLARHTPWGRKELAAKGLAIDGKFCSACFEGDWHGRFPQELYPIGTMETDKNGNLRRKGE